jgi:SAM-dependent methyltransferase
MAGHRSIEEAHGKIAPGGGRVSEHKASYHSAIDRLFTVGQIRRTIWRLWYPFLTGRLRGEEVLFLNYAYEEDPPMGIPLAPEDEPNRAYIQLYHHVATQVALTGKKVLEVSCGHGGGAAYLTRALHPAEYAALDLNSSGIRFCRRRHRLDRLSFVQGDAESLPFESGSFDAVINIEASHCYPSLPKFLAEVTRVLRPGGNFLYADFRFVDEAGEWDAALAAAPLRVLRRKDINAEVLRGMDGNSERSQALIARRLPKWLRPLGRDFAGTRGSRIRLALEAGALSYRSYCFARAGAGD